MIRTHSRRPFSYPFDRRAGIILVLIALVSGLVQLRPGIARADNTNDTLVASLETLTPGVSVKRVDTDSWIAIQKESLVGVGDSVRTTANGTARITFFANGTETDVQPNSEFRIDAFTGSDTQYQLSVTVVAGQTTQRVAKLLDSGSNYTVNSMGLELTVRGTVFAVRVEHSGRSALIVQTGAVKAANQRAAQATAVFKDPTRAENMVPAGNGIRAEPGKGLSDVVPAVNFAALDASLDGCESIIQTLGDVRLNVRLGPDLSFPRVGALPNKELEHILGVSATTHWYRLAYKGGYAWVFAPALKLDQTCAGLRQLPDNWGAEDASQYSGLDSDIDVNAVLSVTPPASRPTMPSATPSVGTPTQAP